MRRRNYTVVPVKKKQPDLFESIFVDNQGGFNEENLKAIGNDLSASPMELNASKVNQSCLLLSLWSKPFETSRETRVSYSAGPNMEQKNTFEAIQYMTRTWKKMTTGLPLPETYTRTTNQRKNTNNVGENNFRLLTPELLGYTAGENWKNKKATLVVPLSKQSFEQLNKQRYRREGKISLEDGQQYFRLVLSTEKSLQSILSSNRYPKAWLRNIYDERNSDIESSKDYIDDIYDELETKNPRTYITLLKNKTEDDIEVALTLESIVNNTAYALGKTEAKIYFNLYKYINNNEYDDKESFFKLIFKGTENDGVKTFLVPLEAENRRFNISNNFKIGLEIPINIFNFIKYVKGESYTYVYVQPTGEDIPYIELSELTWSNKANIFNNSKELNATKEIILKPIFPEQTEEQQIETFSSSNIGVNETYKRLVENNINECVNPKNVYPLERQINLKYGCLIPHTLSKSIFQKTSKLLKDYIARVLESKQGSSFRSSLNESLWLERAKAQLIKYLIKKRQMSLITRLPGFRMWEDVMEEDQELYEWNVVMYKNELYKLNRYSENFIWAQMKQDYLIDKNTKYDKYVKGEILIEDTGQLYEFIENTYLGMGLDETFETIAVADTRLNYDDLNKVVFRPNGYGTKNYSRYYRENVNTSQIYHINPSETPLNNVFLKLQGTEKDSAKNFVATNGLTDWDELQTLTDNDLNRNILISGYEDKNENFINCFDDPKFVKDVEKLWNVESYLPSIYLIEHFEYLKGNLTKSGTNDTNDEFYLDESEKVSIEYTRYNTINVFNNPRNFLNPNEERFKIIVIQNGIRQTIESPWWEAWYTEWVYKRNLFKGEYTQLELEYLDRHYKKIFIDFVNTFSRSFNAPPINFIQTVLR